MSVTHIYIYMYIYIYVYIYMYIYILSVMLQVFVDTSAYTQNIHTHQCPFQFANQKNYCTHGGAGSMSMLTGRRVEIAIV